MITGPALAAGVAVAFLIFGGVEITKGAKWVLHKIERPFHHIKK